MYLVLLIILVLLIVGGLPHWGYSRPWGVGYYPSGIGVILLIVLLVLFLR